MKVLDPACGSGNFLYVSLELMKRLEAEVLEAFEELGVDAGFEMASFKIGPRQFLGLELNRRAVAIAQLVLWIGFFQWQRKTTGKADTNERPLLPKTPSIVQQDAVLAYDEAIPRKDPDTGEVVTIWDGITTKPHPITGNEVPDDSARKVVFDYTNPRRAEWPAADVIVGNPPFIGAAAMREALGNGYVETLRKAWKGDVPESSDFVMYWWGKAAELVRDRTAKRFGFITTNSIHQIFNRRVIEPFLADEKKPLHLGYAIPDHPWVDSADGADVRIAMTVAAHGKGEGTLEKVVYEQAREDGENDVIVVRSTGTLAADFKIGADVSSCQPLRANDDLVSRGVQTIGEGFVLKPDEARHFTASDSEVPQVVRPYLNGKNVTNRPREVSVIDFFGWSEAEVRSRKPALYQHLLTTVKPLRDQNSRDSYRENWWILGEPQPSLRRQLSGLSRFVATPVTAKHRFFIFIPTVTLPDQALNAIASDDGSILGILSSSPHVVWALAAGGRLGVGNDPRYNNTRCFAPFPFPALAEGPLKQRIRDLGERLDAHRKRQQELHPDLTLTGLYNVLEAVRAGRPLNAKEKAIHDKGLVSILKQIHDDLDLAVFEAYGWPDLGAAWKAVAIDGCTLYDRASGTLIQPDLDPAADFDKMLAESRESLEQEILSRLVTLNHERAAEEKRGLVRWLRPDYQAPGTVALPAEEQDEIQLSAGTTAAKSASLPEKLAWPDGLAAQVAAVQKLVPALGPDPEAIAARFGKKSAKRAGQVAEILETLRGLGKL